MEHYLRDPLDTDCRDFFNDDNMQLYRESDGPTANQDTSTPTGNHSLTDMINTDSDHCSDTTYDWLEETIEAWSIRWSSYSTVLEIVTIDQPPLCYPRNST